MQGPPTHPPVLCGNYKNLKVWSCGVGYPDAGLEEGPTAEGWAQAQLITPAPSRSQVMADIL